jgi:hypothetical protein
MKFKGVTGVLEAAFNKFLAGIDMDPITASGYRAFLTESSQYWICSSVHLSKSGALLPIVPMVYCCDNDKELP